MKYIVFGKTLLRYLSMAKDPRTPAIVKGLVYVGVVATLAPKMLHPKRVPGLGLLDERAIVPSIIALAMVLTPKRVREEHDSRERSEQRAAQAEGRRQAMEAATEAR